MLMWVVVSLLLTTVCVLVARYWRPIIGMLHESSFIVLLLRIGRTLVVLDQLVKIMLHQLSFALWRRTLGHDDG